MTKRVTLDDLITASGAGPRSVRRLVREGKLPGFMDGNRYVCSPGEFQDWLDGVWQYRGVPSTPARQRNDVDTHQVDERNPLVVNIRDYGHAV